MQKLLHLYTYVHGVKSSGAIEGDDSDAVWVNATLDELIGAGHDRKCSEKERAFGGFAQRELRI